MRSGDAAANGTVSIRRTLEILHEPGEVFEVRIPKTKERTVSGYFNDAARAASAIATLDRRTDVHGIYGTLNPIQGSLHSRAYDRLKPNAENTTGDKDIVCRRWLLVDLDPVRPAGISSSDEEHAAALRRGHDVFAFLRECGWPDPVVGDSGNGGQLLYAIDLPNDDPARKLVEHVLTALDIRFSDERVKIDTSVGNPARIGKVFGTMTRKGDHTLERPHRRSVLIYEPKERVIVPRELLEKLAAIVPADVTPQRTATAPQRVDLGAFMADHAIAACRTKSWNGWMVYVLSHCLFDDSHSGSCAVLMQHSGGALKYRCEHDSCQRYGWRDVREKFEPRPYERVRITDRVPESASELVSGMARTEAVMSACEPSSLQEPPVNLATLLGQIKAFILRFVLLPKTEAVVVYLTLWVFHTHAIDAADHTPFTIITSPRKRSGKSRLEEVLRCLVARPWMTQRTTVAALVRKVAKEHCTLLLDETDAAFAGDQVYSQALRAVLDAAHTRGATATLCVGQGSKMEARDFEMFTAVAIAGIGRLPDTVEDRGVRIGMKRKTKAESVERFRPRKVKAEAEALRARIAVAAKEALGVLRNSEPDLPDELNDRAQDGWEPLLAIADAADADWPELARQAARALSGDRVEDDDQNPSAWLLRDIRTAFAATPNDADGVAMWVPTWDAADRLHTSEMSDRLCQVPGSPWATWRRGEPITANAIAKLLEGYTDADGNQIHSKQMKLNGVNRNGYELADFEDAFLRFLPPVAE